VPSTLQALAVLALGLLPGALYVWGFEREAGQWGVSTSDRVLRFIGASAIIHALIAPLTWLLWRSEVRTAELAEGRTAWWLIWIVALVYVGVPSLVGIGVGRAARQDQKWVRWMAGPHPAPRAWDHLFASEPTGWVRIKLRSGTWVGGLFATVETGRSYAAGFPHDRDLLLSTIAEVDPATGEFRLEDGKSITRGSSLLVSWAEVEYLEFIPAQPK
jgi:hypothetical protein